jgi:transcriptional regulator with XRE-family HTH domain
MTEEVLSPILQFLETHPEYNVTTLARDCNVSRVTLSRVANGKQKPLFDTGERIRKVTSIRYERLLAYYRSVNG